jgi:hypothetical protein
MGKNMINLTYKGINPQTGKNSITYITTCITMQKKKKKTKNPTTEDMP